MAGVAKWLRQWVVVPPFVGSSPITRPKKVKIYKKDTPQILAKRILKEEHVLYPKALIKVFSSL